MLLAAPPPLPPPMIFLMRPLSLDRNPAFFLKKTH
jgi:hypothetical protein